MVEKIEDLSDSNTGRSLASVQTIKAIIKHSNADRLYLATVLGWQVVVGDNEFQVNDKCIYFEIDSLLPEKTWSEIFRAKKFKIKTVKIRGEISQGLALPLSILDQYTDDNGNPLSTDPNSYPEGFNLTNILGVKKFEDDADLPVSGGKSKVSSFPENFGFMKTDERRIQSCPKLIDHMKDKPYYATIKYDGSSATYYYDKSTDEYYILSRNQKRQYDKSEAYSKISDLYKIKDILLKHDGRFALQGEAYGPSIQKNLLEKKQLHYAVFNVYDTMEKRYLDYDEMVDYLKSVGLEMVKVELEGDSFNYSILELKAISKGMYEGTKKPREGLVFRSKKNWAENCSFKIINDDYLLSK